MAKPVGNCWECKKAITAGQFITVADMSYHGTCFNCLRCGTSVYGKQFAPVGAPKTPTWKIYCADCDTLAANNTDISYTDKRSFEEKKKVPVEKPRLRIEEPVFEPIKKEPSAVQKVTSIHKEREAEQVRKQRLLDMEAKARDQNKERTDQNLQTARVLKSKQQEADQQEKQRLDEVKRRDAEEQEKRRAAAKASESERQQRKELESNIPENYEEIEIPLPPSHTPTSTFPKPKGGGPPPPPSGGGPPPPPPSGGGPPPPPPPSGGGPPPPPPPGGAVRRPPPAPKASSESSSRPANSDLLPAGASSDSNRNALLDSIKSFRKNNLKPTDTVDKSGPAIDTSTGGSEGGGSRPPPAGARGMPGMGGLAAMVAAQARRGQNY